MSWAPSTTELGPHAEFENFSHTITYEVVDEILGTISYSVRIIPQQTLPATVNITGATLSGYFKHVFNDTLKYRTFNQQTKTVVTDSDNGAWDKLNTNDVFEFTSFKADTSRSRIYNYVAEAYDPLIPGTVVASQNYTLNVQDLNWAPGLLALKEIVTLTQSR